MHAMLSLDLNEKVTGEERRKFYGHIKDSGWVKIAKLSTAWCATYKKTATEEKIIAEVKVDVAAAAKYSGVSAYDAVVNISQSRPSAI